VKRDLKFVRMANMTFAVALMTMFTGLVTASGNELEECKTNIPMVNEAESGFIEGFMQEDKLDDVNIFKQASAKRMKLPTGVSNGFFVRGWSTDVDFKRITAVTLDDRDPFIWPDNWLESKKTPKLEIGSTVRGTQRYWCYDNFQGSCLSMDGELEPYKEVVLQVGKNVKGFKNVYRYTMNMGMDFARCDLIDLNSKYFQSWEPPRGDTIFKPEPPVELRPLIASTLMAPDSLFAAGYAAAEGRLLKAQLNSLKPKVKDKTRSLLGRKALLGPWIKTSTVRLDGESKPMQVKRMHKLLDVLKHHSKGFNKLIKEQVYCFAGISESGEASYNKYDSYDVERANRLLGWVNPEFKKNIR